MATGSGYLCLVAGLGSISPNRILPNPILPNLFLIDGPTTTTCFVIFCFFAKLCFVIHHFFCTIFWLTVSKYMTGVVSFRLISCTILLARGYVHYWKRRRRISFRNPHPNPNSNPNPNPNPSSISVRALQ